MGGPHAVVRRDQLGRPPSATDRARVDAEAARRPAGRRAATGADAGDAATAERPGGGRARRRPSPERPDDAVPCRRWFGTIASRSHCASSPGSGRGGSPGRSPTSRAGRSAWARLDRFRWPRPAAPLHNGGRSPVADDQLGRTAPAAADAWTCDETDRHESGSRSTWRRPAWWPRSTGWSRSARSGSTPRGASSGGSSGWSIPSGRCRPPPQAIHGISDADLAGAPRAREVLPEFLAFLGDPATAALLAHNAAFDAGFLGRELARARPDRPGHAVVDTLALARRRLPELLQPSARHAGAALQPGPDGPAPRPGRQPARQGALARPRGTAEPGEALVSYPIFDPARPVVLPLGWDELVEAIATGWRVRMEYAGGTRGEAPREVTPRAFVHRGGVPYLVAFCHLDAFEKSFRLDRVPATRSWSSRRTEIASWNARPAADGLKESPTLDP